MIGTERSCQTADAHLRCTLVDVPVGWGRQPGQYVLEVDEWSCRA